MGYVYERQDRWNNAKEYLELLKDEKEEEHSYQHLQNIMDKFERNGNLTMEEHFAIFVAHKSWRGEQMR